MTSFIDQLQRGLIESHAENAAQMVGQAKDDLFRAITALALARAEIGSAQNLAPLVSGVSAANLNLAKFHLEEALKFISTYTAPMSRSPLPAGEGQGEGPAPVIDVQTTLQETKP